MLVVIVNIVIGLIMGGLMVALANLIKRPHDNQIKQISFGVICLFFGALGAVAADQLLTYGPTLFDVNYVPSMVGGLVMAFVAAYPIKRWLRF